MIYTCRKKASTLASCNFDNHGLILIILGNQQVPVQVQVQVPEVQVQLYVHCTWGSNRPTSTSAQVQVHVYTYTYIMATLNYKGGIIVHYQTSLITE